MTETSTPVLAAPAPPPLPGWAPVAAGGLVTAGLGATLWASAHLHSDPVLREVALFAHLGCLVLGFGGVLALDWLGLLWLLGRRSLADVLRVAADVRLPIWIGYAGLVASGMLLEPDLGDPATRLKLALVLMIGWNGIAASALGSTLAGSDDAAAARRLLLVSGVATVVSQCGWWGAMVLGFRNSG